MGKISNSILGVVQGRVGNVVFSRNKGGVYVKSFRKPTNANSQAQKNIRNIMRSISGAWTALSVDLRNAWADFAKSTFNPGRRTNKGNYTAVQAFRSLRTAALSNSEKLRSAAFFKNHDLTTISAVFCNPNLVDTPPVLSVRPDILDQLNTGYNYMVDAATIISTGTAEISLAIQGIGAGGITQDQLIDENSIQYGFNAWISEGHKSPNMHVGNAMRHCIGFSGIPTFSGGGLSSATSIQFKWNFSDLLPNFKAFPYAGQSALLTVGVVSIDGTFSVAASDWVTLT